MEIKLPSVGPSTSGINPSTGLEGKQKTLALPTDNISAPFMQNDAFLRGGQPFGIDPTEFKFQLKPGADNYELRAQDQSVGEQTLYGAGRLIGTTATKFLEGAGYLYGVGEALLTDKGIGDALDNGWTNFWGNADEAVKEALPIYHTKKYNEGNILKQMSTYGFWMDDVIDGVAFLASAYIGSAGIGAASKGVGAYTALAKNLSKAMVAARTGKVSARTLPKLASMAREMDLVTMSAFNSVVEAGFEAKDVMDQLQAQGVSKENAAKAAQGTFLWNTAVLMGPNYITNSMFFGKANPMSGRIKNIVGPDGRLISEVKPITNAQRAASFAKGAGVSVASEGPWEENIQLAISDYFTNKGEGKEKEGQFAKIFKNWANNFTTDEGTKNIALGSLIGLIPGGVSGIREAKADKANEAVLHTMLGSTIATVTKDLEKKDIWLRDKDKNLVVDEKTKQPVVDPYKLATFFVLSHYTTENAVSTLVNLAKGNEIMADRLDEERVASLAFSHMGSADGVDTFDAEMDLYAKQKIDSMTAKGETVNEDKVKQLAAQYKQRGRLYKTLYDNVQEVFAGLYDFTDKATGDKNTDTQLYNLANSIKDQAILTQFMASVDQMFWLDKVRELQTEIAKINSTTVGETELGKNNILKLEKLVEAATEQVKESEKVVKQVLKESYWKNNYNKSKQNVLAEIEQQNSTNKPVENKPTTDEFVKITDKDGNIYTYHGKDDKGLNIIKDKDGKELHYLTSELTDKGITLTDDKKTPIADYLTRLDEEAANRGTVTPTGATVQDEVTAREEVDKPTQDEIEEQNKARKASVIEELTAPSTELTGAETEEEIGRLQLGESIAEQYGDDNLANMNLAQIFNSPLKDEQLHVVYQGEHGTLFIDPETNEVVFKATNSGKETIIGKTTDDELYNGSVKAIDLGIIPLKHTTFDIQLAGDGVGIIVQGRRYVLDIDNPLSAIQEVDGEIQVTLKDLNGVPITFTSQTLAAELAYAIELLNEAREVAYKTYLDRFDSDFVTVNDPKGTGKFFYVYRMPDGSHEILQPVVREIAEKTAYINPSKDNYRRIPKTLKNGKPNPRYNAILNSYLSDLNNIIERVAAEHIAAGQRMDDEMRAEIQKQLQDEIEEFVRNSRPATEKEIITAPGTTEVSSVKTAEAEATGKSTVAETTASAKSEQPAGKSQVVEEVEVVPSKKKGKKSKDEEEILDEKADEVVAGKKGKKSSKGKAAEDQGIEIINETDNEFVELQKREASHSIAHPATGVAWKAEDNTELDAFLSNPESNLDGYKLVASIDYDATDSVWADKERDPDYIKRNLDNIYNDRHNEDAFDSLVDRVVIKLTLVDKDGKELPFGGMYMHRSNFAEEDTVVVTEAQKKLYESGDIAAYNASRAEMIKVERKATRAQRKAILIDLLANKSVQLTGLKRGAGVMSQSKGENRSLLEVTSSADNGTVVVADRQGTLWDGKGKDLPGRGSPGNVLWVTEETVNGETRIVKLNVSKVSEEHAEILLEAFRQLATSEAGPSTLFKHDKVEGDLTVGEVINYLVLDGDITDQNNKEKNLTYAPHLVPKTLRASKGILYYGTKKLDLRKKISKEQLTDFINHITTNKNYIVPLASRRKSGIGLGGKIKKSFRIGSIDAKEGESYQSFLIRNKLIQTDLIKDQATGRIFSKPAFWFDSYVKEEKLPKPKPVDKSKESKPKKNEVTEKEVKKAKAVSQTLDESNLPKLKPSDLATLPEGVDIFTWFRGAQAINEQDEAIGGVGQDIHVIGRTVRNNSGQLVFKLKATDKHKKKVLAEFDGVEMTHPSLKQIFKLMDDPIHAEMPTETPADMSDALTDTSDKTIQEELNQAWGIDDAPFEHRYTGGAYTQGDLNKAIATVRKKLGNNFTIKTEEDLIRVIEGTGTVLAFGTFQRDAITLSRKLAKGTEYEEAFHRVSLLYLTPEQQQEIYKEAKVKYHMPKATDRELNERIAQDYREMEVAGTKVIGPKTITGKIKQFFIDLYDFIRTVFTGQLHISYLDINNLLRVTQRSSGRTGRLWHAKPNTRSYALLKNGDSYTHAVKGRELTHVKNTAQLTDIVKHLVFTMINRSGVIKTKDLSKLNYYTAYEAMKGAVLVVANNVSKNEAAGKKAIANKYRNIQGLYQEIVDNFDIYLDLMKSQIEALGIRTILPEDPENEGDARGDNFARYDKASFEVDGKDNAGAAIKLVLATLRSTPDVNNETLMHQFVDYDSIYDTLQSELSELNSVEEMVKVLQSKPSIPYKDLLSKLNADRAEDKFDTLHTQFFHAMRKNRYKFRNALVTKEGERANIEIADAETQRVSDAQTVVWGQAFMLSNAFVKGMPNKAFLAEVIGDYTRLSTLAKREYANKANNKELPSYNDIFNGVITLFNKVSIPMDKDVLNNILSRMEGDTKHEQLMSLLVRSKMAPVFGAGGTFARLSVHGAVTNNKGRKLPSDNIYRNEQLFKMIVAPSYVEVHGGIRTNSILGPDGNPYYLLSENSYITDLFHAIRTNPASGISYKHLANVPYNEHSYYLRQLADPEVRKRLEVTMFSYLAVMGANDRGRGYADISDIEDTMAKMALFEAGLVVLPQLADRKNLYTMSGLKPLEFHYTYDEATNKLTIPQSVVDIFYFYAVDEYKQIKRTREEIEDAIANGTEEKLKENFHFTYKPDGTRDYTAGNGLKYHHFTEFNGTNYKLDPRELNNDSLLLKYKLAVRKILEARIKDGIKFMNKQGIVKVGFENYGNIASVSNLLFSQTALRKESEAFGGNTDATLRNKIANFTLNSIMATIEAEKMIFMSPAYYKNLDDKIKRATAISSTGTVSRLNFPNSILKGERLLHDHDTFYSSVLATQKYDAVHVREMLKPKFVAIYKKNGYTDAAAEKKADQVLKGYTEVDPTDAQAYITPHMYRALSIRLGEWSDVKEAAFELMLTDRELTAAEQNVLDELFMQPLKFGYFGPEMGPGGMMSPLYYKTSLATLTPRLVKGTQLQDLYDRMMDEKDPIDMVLFDSAVKAGVDSKMPYYAENKGEVNTDLVNSALLSDMSITAASFQYLRRQTITDPHNELRDTVKTQFRKVALSNIVDDRTYTVNGKKITGKELKDENKALMDELSDRGAKEFLDLIGVDEDTMLSNDPQKLYDLVRSKARMSGMPDALVDALATQADGDMYETDAIPERKWIQSAMISLLAKKTVDIKLPGTAMIQMSNFGLRNAELDDSLQLIDKDGYMEAMVSIEVFRNAIPNYHSKTYEERIKFVNTMFKGIGYRVPTQGLVSTVPLKIVGFLPETSTATIVLPSEFTMLTGSDFDIDKLYFIRYNYKVTGDKAVKVEYLTDKNSTVDERFDLFSYDAIADKARLMKKAWYTSMSEIYQDRAELNATIASLRDDTDGWMTDDIEVDINSPDYITLLDKQRKQRAKELKMEKKELNLLIKQQSKELDDAIEEERLNWKDEHVVEFLDRPIVKQNISQAVENQLLDTYFAVLLSNDHIIDNYMPLDTATGWLKGLAKEINDLEGTTRDYPSLYTASFMYQSEVKHKYLWGKKGIGPFARANVHHVLGQIAGLYLNTYLGVGNKIEIDGNTYTDLSQIKGTDGENILDWLSALINAHVDIAKDAYIFALNVNNSTYSVGEMLIRAGVGKETFLFLAQPILKEYAAAHNDSKGKIRSSKMKPLTKVRKSYESILKRKMQEEGLKQKPEVNEDEFDGTRLRKDLNEETERDAAYYARQLQILDKFSDLNSLGTFLFQAVEATNVDTKRFGNNLAELRRFNKLVNKVLTDNVVRNMDKVFDMTFIGNYYKNSVLLGQSLFKDTTVMASECVVALADQILMEIGESNNITNDGLWYINRINDEIFSSIVGRFMANRMKVGPEKLSDMLYGDNSMVARLNIIKSNTKHADNPLIKLLQPSMSFKPGIPDIVITFAAMDSKTKWAKDRIIDGWAEMLTSNDPEIKSFAEDLVAYSFYTSGFRKSMYSIYNFIPPSYLKEIGFSEDIRELRTKLNDINNYALLSNIRDDVYQNMWEDDDIVPAIHYTDLGEKRVPPKNSDWWGVKYPVQVSVRGDAVNKLAVGYNDLGEMLFRPFIKIAAVDHSTQLYKFAGYITVGNKVEPVYVISQKKGFSEAGKVVKEHGLKTSVIERNQSKLAPEDLNLAAVGYRQIEDSEEKTVTYDFSTIQTISPEHQVIATSISDTEDLIEETPEPTVIPPTTKIEDTSSVEGFNEEKRNKTNDKFKHCK